MDEKNLKPDLFPSRDALVITMINPTAPQGGSSSLMWNFLTSFDSKSYRVISTRPRGKQRSGKLEVEPLLTDVYTYRKPIQRIFWALWLKRDVKRIQRFVDEFNPKFILIVYPHLYNCEVFLRLRLPPTCKVAGYFHDTFIEGQKGKVNSKKLTFYHSRLLASIGVLYVMNEGMRELYARKYNRQAIALEHTFPEYDEYKTMPLNIQNRDRRFFWGGNVVGYNVNSLSRLADLAQACNYELKIASRQPFKSLARMLNKSDLIHAFYTDREEYIQALRSNSFLLLALDWPDETSYHEEEIGTIFSTKAIEYLMAGVPIILHAPEEYFMSRFLIENQCGYVIGTRDKNVMKEQFISLTNKDHSEVVRNAIAVSTLFSVKSVMNKWLNGIRLLR